jgi:hypothetical protein
MIKRKKDARDENFQQNHLIILSWIRSQSLNLPDPFPDDV